jgi:hypothetical protein
MRGLTHSHYPLRRYTFERKFGGCSQTLLFEGSEDAGFEILGRKSAMGGGFSLNGAREDS